MDVSVSEFSPAFIFRLWAQTEPPTTQSKELTKAFSYG